MAKKRKQTNPKVTKVSKRALQIGDEAPDFRVTDVAKRVTFVVGRERQILHCERGNSAISSNGAAEACALF